MTNDAFLYCCKTALLFIALLITPSLQAEVQATLDRDSIYAGETLTLIIEASGRGLAGDPELSELQQDFDILGTSSSQQLQIINGKRSDKRQWHIELVPKRTGKITVPPVRVGDSKTQSLELTVEERPEAVSASSGQPLFIKTQTEPVNTTVYVQQQIHYTVQLYYRESLAEGNFGDPVIEHAIIERLGEDRRFNTRSGDQMYSVIERRYAIFPEQSGRLIIPPAVFTGRMVGVARQRQPGRRMDSMLERFFGSTTLTVPGKRVRVRSEAISFDVLPRPDTYTGQFWLPSEQLVLSDSWTAGPPELHAGEPVTRTITLEAKGLESSHLPDLELAGSAGVRLYPEQPLYETRTDGDWIYGRRAQSVAYVPSAAGMITLPAIHVEWWNTREQRQERAVLPAWQLNVLPGVAGTGQDPQPAGSEGESLVAELSAEAVTRSWQVDLKHTWPWLLVGLPGIGLFFILRRYLPWLEHRSTSKKSRNMALHRLESACRNNDAQAAASSLLQWAAARWPDNSPHNLGSLAQCLDSGRAAVRELDQALYGAIKREWQGEALWQVFRQGVAEGEQAGPAAKAYLSPLYPDWT